MSDSEQDWKPNGRPQSTMAQAFSTALDSLFELDSEVPHLTQTIDEKKFKMIIQNRELEELQARIREAENRLKARQSLLIENPAVPESQAEGEYQSTDSTTSATSPTDMAGQYSSGDEQRQQEQEHKEKQQRNL